MKNDVAVDGEALAAVLGALRSGDAATRPDLSLRTGAGRGMVAKCVAELTDRGLVEESGLGPSSGGRAPRRLRFRAEAGHVLAVEIGVTSVGVAVADLAGTILAHVDEPADLSAGPVATLDRAAALAQTFAAPGKLWGIGIGVPGPVDFETGRCSAPPVVGWEGFSVRDHLAERYGAPVWVDNEVNAMALGELRAGVARGADTVVFAKVGTRIGGALISGGRLHRGSEGGAGEFGHLRVTDDPEVICRCGRIGCLAALAGGDALARDGEALARDGRSPLLAEVAGRITAADVARVARAGDGRCRALIAENGRRIGRALAMVVNVFDPSLIVVGGGVTRAGDELLAAIRESVYAHSLPVATRNLVVERAALGERGGVTGAALMAVDELFAPARAAHWAAA